MTISLAAAVTFIFTQLIPLPNGGVLKLNMDVTDSVPYTMQGKDIIIQ